MKYYNLLWVVKMLCAIFLFGVSFTTVLCGFASYPQVDINTSSTDDVSIDRNISKDIGDDFVKDNSSNKLTQDESRLHYISVVITADDTLWSIANKYRTDDNGSIKDYISLIKYCNNMTSDFIYAGSHLVIPVYEL